MKTIDSFGKLPVLFLLLIPFLAQCQKYGGMTGGVVDGVEVGLAIKPAKPVAGENQFKVMFKDPSGPIQNAKVRVAYFMPAMGTMPVMQGGAPGAASAPGEYTATLNLPMEGNWTITVRAEIPGKGEIVAAFRIRTGSATVAFEGG